MLPTWPLLTVRVHDTSMQPELWPGDRLLVLRILRSRVGDIVLVRDPEYKRRLLVKRVAARTQGGEYVLSADNPNVGRDSRHFGPVPRALIVGRVVWRYHPGQATPHARLH